MKSLKLYLEEMATPSNTLGVGNPIPPMGENVGSEPLILVSKTRKKKCKKCVKESILGDWNDVNAEEVADNVIKKSINDFLDDNYYYMNQKYYDIVKDDNKYIVNVHQNCDIKNHKIKNLTGGLFEFGEVDGDFNCAFCKSLKSLEGSPRKVKGNFSCYFCKSLTSLEGAPEKVGESFSCDNCSSLKSLEGAPKEVGSSFYCRFCKNLTTLKGSPEKVGEDFSCVNCENLTSLKGAPKKVGSDFYCSYCKNLKTIDWAPKKAKGVHIEFTNIDKNDVEMYGDYEMVYK